MANEFYTGTEGVIKIGSSPATLAQVQTFAFSIANIVAKQRNKGDAYPTRKSVGRDLTGSLTFTWNPTLTSHQDLLTAVNAGTALDLVLFPTGESAGRKVTVQVIPTKIDIPSQEPESTDPVTASIEFEANGAPTIAAVA